MSMSMPQDDVERKCEDDRTYSDTHNGPSLSRAKTIATIERDFEELVDWLIREDPTYADAFERRYGGKGSLLINLEEARWYSFEAGKGGGIKALVQFLNECSEAETWSILADFVEGRDPCEAPEIRRQNAAEREAARIEKLRHKQAEGRMRVAQSAEYLHHPACDAALAYLSHRGIKPSKAALPHLPVAFKPRQFNRKDEWRYKSCVFAATIEIAAEPLKGAERPHEGELKLQALQHVFVTDRGEKVTRIRHDKRTIGCLHGAAVRFTPQDYDGPLFLTDGPEDALTLYLHAGVEAWALLRGISGGGVLDLDIPRRRHVVLQGDNDESDSPAMHALRWARHDVASAGYRVDLVLPPPGFKDPNELLLKEGRDAVHEVYEQLLGEIR